MTAFYEARIRAEWQDWTFGAHQAASRAAANEDLITLRRQYTELTEQDLHRLAASWRSDDTSSAYFTFAAADIDDNPALVAVSATFVRALFHELGDQVPPALAALLTRWTEQRRQATRAGIQPTPVQPPRVSVLLPRDESLWPPESWDAFAELELDAQHFDNTLLRWDADSRLWLQIGAAAQDAPPNPHDDHEPSPPAADQDNRAS